MMTRREWYRWRSGAYDIETRFRLTFVTLLRDRAVGTTYYDEDCRQISTILAGGRMTSLSISGYDLMAVAADDLRIPQIWGFEKYDALKAAVAPPQRFA